MTIPCMGGFCSSRDHCPNYSAKPSKIQPMERLCGAIEITDQRQRNATFYRNAANRRNTAGTNAGIGHPASHTATGRDAGH